MSSDSNTRPRPTSLRRDLQGLRGIGVAFVVVGHLWRWPDGAFAMLDMFFVMSGFLITAILADKFPQYGAKFFVVFYLSRFRRLVPAAALVIVVMTSLFYLVFSSARGHLVAIDGAWALAFLSNWHFTAEGADYFHDQIPSPFVHYWSLSVEEQFYAVWPLLIFVVLLVVAAAKWRSSERALLGVLGLVTAASFGYSLWHSVAAPLAAYFSTFDRVWEFGIGAILGILGPRFARMPLWAGITLGWLGCIGIVVTVFVLPQGVPFPAPYGLLPVLLTGAILVGGIGRDTRYLPMVDNRLMIYLGDISYSLYLWHLPLAVLLLAWFPVDVPAFYISAIALSLTAAIATFHLVERPLRRAPFLMTPPERERLRAPSPTARAQSRRVGWLALASATVAALCTAALAPHVVSAAERVPVSVPTIDPAAHYVPPTLVDDQQRRLARALEATSFPDLSPGLADLGFDNWVTTEGDFGCVEVTADDEDQCRFGDGKRVALVVGDSYAVGWMPGIRAALEPRGWTVQQFTMTQCPAWTLPSYVTIDETAYPECASHHRDVQSYVDGQRPELVILASADLNVRNAERADIAGDGAEVARRALTTTINDLRASGSRIVVLGSPPAHVAPLTCVTRVGSPADCDSDLNQTWHDSVEGESAAAAATGVRYISTRDWFCYWGRCPGIVGDTPVTVDGSHLTIQFSRELAPLLREALLGTPSTVSP